MHVQVTKHTGVTYDQVSISYGDMHCRFPPNMFTVHPMDATINTLSHFKAFLVSIVRNANSIM
jgi:hypothetical protein